MTPRQFNSIINPNLPTNWLHWTNKEKEPGYYTLKILEENMKGRIILVHFSKGGFYYGCQDLIKETFIQIDFKKII